VTNWFVHRIRAFGSRTAICFGNDKTPYSRLYDLIEEYYEQLREKLHRGSVTAIVSDYTPHSIALFFTLIENKNIIVPVFTSNQSEIQERIDESHADNVIYFSAEGISISKTGEQRKHPLIKKLQEANSSGLVLFTSGSTGKPKAMLHDLDNLLLSYKRNYTKDINTLIFLTIDHIGGVDTLLRQISIGGAVTIPEQRTPEHICALIEKFKVDVLPVSPTFLNLLFLSEAYKNFDLSSLRIIGYGAEPIGELLLKRLNQEFPGVRIQQKFGTSETNAIKVESFSPDSTFMKITDPNIEYRVVNNELWLKSRTRIVGYLNKDTDEEDFTEDGWFRTGDLIEVMTPSSSGSGDYFRIIGRVREIINVGGQKVLPAEVETILMQMPEVVDCTVYGSPNAITGQTVAADVVLKVKGDDREIKKQIRKFCAGKLDAYKIPTRINIVEKTNYGERFKKIRIK
jgi:acyl-CoA synthetase (AMP-forming)/AMP-acid ligase II